MQLPDKYTFLVTPGFNPPFFFSSSWYKGVPLDSPELLVHINTMASHCGGLEYSELSQEKPVLRRVDKAVPEDYFSVFGL